MQRFDVTVIEKLELSPEAVKSQLLQCDPKKSACPDAVHPHILKLVDFEITPTLVALLNETLAVRELPEDWSQAVLISLHKNSQGGTRTAIDLSFPPLLCTS